MNNDKTLVRELLSDLKDMNPEYKDQFNSILRYIVRLENNNEDERDTCIRFGVERQDALNELRWLRASINVILNELPTEEPKITMFLYRFGDETYAVDTHLYSVAQKLRAALELNRD